MMSGKSRAAAAALSVLGLGLGTVACGTAAPSAHRSSTPTAGVRLPCAARARDVLAHAAAVAAGAIIASPFTTPSGLVSCHFTTRRGTGPLDVTAELDSAPQTYFRLEREIEEYAQNVIWGHLGKQAIPRTIPHLGFEADWFPRDRRLATGDAERLITVIVIASPAHAGGGEAIAEQLARIYLHPAPLHATA
jgi:hypothetical protein